MNDAISLVIAVIVLFIALPVLILWLKDRVSRLIWSWRNPPEKLAADRKAYEARILNPDWEFYEHHLQRPIPTALRELYADRELITANDLDYSETEQISTFEPLDQEGLLDTRPWLGFDAVSIASSDAGDPIYLRPGKSEPDTVFITHHDGGDTEIFAESVAAMVTQIRKANPRGN